MLHARIAETGGDIAHRNPGPWVPRMLDASPDGRVVIEWRQGERLLVADQGEGFSLLDGEADLVGGADPADLAAHDAGDDRVVFG